MHGRSGVGDDPIGAPDGERHEHPHPEREQATVCLREAPVDQVVDGDDAPEAPPARRRRAERVEQVDVLARGQARQQLLLGANPLGAPRGVHRHDDRAPQFPPRSGLVLGLAVDEGHEARVGRREAGDRAEQLARIDLHPTGASGHEEDQVQADGRHAPGG